MQLSSYIQRQWTGVPALKKEKKKEKHRGIKGDTVGEDER